MILNSFTWKYQMKTKILSVELIFILGIKELPKIILQETLVNHPQNHWKQGETKKHNSRNNTQ